MHTFTGLPNSSSSKLSRAILFVQPLWWQNMLYPLVHFPLSLSPAPLSFSPNQAWVAPVNHSAVLKPLPFMVIASKPPALLTIITGSPQSYHLGECLHPTLFSWQHGCSQKRPRVTETSRLNKVMSYFMMHSQQCRNKSNCSWNSAVLKQYTSLWWGLPESPS